jgi:DNA-binding transcriptional MerR regulator
MLYICTMREKNIIDKFIKMKTSPLDFMRNTTFKRSELNLDARVANHWAEKGLFPKKYDTGSWFIFDLTDAFWIKIVMKLREFNVSLEVIKHIKEEFFNTPKSIIDIENKELVIQKLKDLKMFKEEEVNQITDDEIWDKVFNIKLNDFEKMLQSILLERKQYFIILNNKGNVILSNEENIESLNDNNYLAKYQEIISKSHLRISMNEVLREFVETLGELVCTEKIPILTKMELETIQLMKMEETFTLNLRRAGQSDYDIIHLNENNRNEYQKLVYELIIEKKYRNIVIESRNRKFHILEINA